ncbi:hypothetical protein AB1Y20_017108 [Prymnesium parvum]|uniref:TIR domain-containing protein n=1 Tax=Prymnesium parvum TaxID=97485 RepID=A0AB34I949_PRYPA
MPHPLHTPPPPSRLTCLLASPAFPPHLPSRLTRLTRLTRLRPHLPSPNPPSHVSLAITPHPPSRATCLHALPAITPHPPNGSHAFARLTCLHASPAFTRHLPSRLTCLHFSPAFARLTRLRTPHPPSRLTYQRTPHPPSHRPASRLTRLLASPAFTPHPPSRATRLTPHLPSRLIRLRTPHPPSRLTRHHASPAQRLTRLHASPAFTRHLPSLATCLHASPAFTPHPSNASPVFTPHLPSHASPAFARLTRLIASPAFTRHPPARLICLRLTRLHLSHAACFTRHPPSRAARLHALPAFTRCPPAHATRLHAPPVFTRHPPSRATRLHASPAITPHPPNAASPAFASPAFASPAITPHPPACATRLHASPACTRHSPPSRLTRLHPPQPPFTPHPPSSHLPSRLTRLHPPQPPFTPHPPTPATPPLHASPAFVSPAFARHPPSRATRLRLTRHHASPAITPRPPSRLTCLHTSPAITRRPPARATRLLAPPAFTRCPPSRLTRLHASPTFTPHPPSRLTRLHASPAFTPHPPSRATRLHVPPAFTCHPPSCPTCPHASPAFTPHPPSRLTRLHGSPAISPHHLHASPVVTLYPTSRLTCLHTSPALSAVTPHAGDEIKYIVPALLTKPIAPPSSLSSETCCLVLHFELADRFPAKRNLVVKEAALNKGFLPQGLIHHLFGSAAGWTYHTTDGLEPRLGRGSAHVSFGLQQLVLEHVRRQPFLIRCTIVGIGKDSVGGAAYAACNRLRLLTDQVMQRFPALRYRMLLPLRSARDTLIDVQQLAAAGDVAVFVRDQPWNINRVKEELSVWLRPPTPPSLYDCFFSYSHHGAFDSPFIQRVHDATTVWCHVAFLDQYSLKPGVDLAFACMLAIVNSRLLVPLISWSSLRRLSVLTTDSECNYYLLELTLIVLLKELYEVPVLPIFVGASDTDGSPDASVDLFACRPPKASTEDGLLNELDKATNKPVLDSRTVFDRMPTVAVRKVTEQICCFFERQGKEIPSELANLTVNAVVNNLRGSKGVVTWKSSSAHSRSRKQHWGLEMRVAEEVHFAIEATPPELPKLKFAKPAHPGEQDKALEQLARDMKEMKSDIREVMEMKSDIREVKSDVKEVKLDVKVVLQLSEVHFKLLSTLLKGARNKHFEDSIHFFRHQVDHRRVIPIHVSTKLQKADGFTKLLDNSAFKLWKTNVVQFDAC